MKETKYTVSLPQLRLQPPLPMLPAPLTPPILPAPRPPPLLPASQSFEQQAGNDDTGGQAERFRLNAKAQSWVPYEQNAQSYWAQSMGEKSLGTPAASATTASSGENTLLDLLRDEQRRTIVPDTLVDATCEVLQRHSLNCPNEPAGFVSLRQIYPNKQINGLWDLYVKCNGDVDWAVDILLKEDELNADGADYTANVEDDKQFQCACNRLQEQTTSMMSTQSSSSNSIGKFVPKPQRQPRAKRNGGVSCANSSASKELQMHVENCFVLGDDQYSEHTRKIRDIRNGILDQPLPPPVDTAPLVIAQNEDDEDPEDNVLLEMELGETLIEQLRNNFQWEGEMLPVELESSPTKVFVPRQVAKQLYMVWMEAVHNQLEEQRQQKLRDDEQFARLLKHPKYAECSESPGNIDELLDMELAWSIYNSDKQAATQALREKPNDIATHLTKMKLCEKFPDIPKETVLEVFEATDHNYGKTVEVLDSNVQSELTSAELFEQAIRENEKVCHIDYTYINIYLLTFLTHFHCSSMLSSSRRNSSNCQQNCRVHVPQEMLSCSHRNCTKRQNLQH